MSISLDDLAAGKGVSTTKKSGGGGKGLFGKLFSTSVKDKLSLAGEAVALPTKGVSAVFGGLSKVPGLGSPAGQARSITDQIHGVQAGLLPGALDLVSNEVKATGNTILHPSRSPVALAYRTVTGQNRDGSFVKDFEKSLRQGSPFAAGMGESFARTGERGWELANSNTFAPVAPLASSVNPFRNNKSLSETQYGQAWKNGTIVPTLIEDAGNVAIVGGVATKVFSGAAGQAAARVAQLEAAGASPEVIAQAQARAARLASMSEGVNKVTAATQHIADAPARPLKMLARGAREVAGSETAAKVLGSDLMSPVVERAASLKKTLGMTPEARGLRELDQEVKRGAGEEARRIGLEGKAVKKNLKVLGREVGATPEDLAAALQAKKAGLDIVYRDLQSQPEQFRPAMLDATFGVKQQLSPAQIELLLNDDLMARASESYSPLMSGLARDAETKSRAGILNPEQLGDVPMQSAIDRLVERGVDPALLEQGPAMVAPGKYKPALFAVEKYKRALAEAGLEDRLPEATMKDLGVTPEYMPGGFEDPTMSPGIGAPRNIQERKLISQREKKGGNVLKSVNRVTEQRARDMVTILQNEGVGKIKEQYVRTPEQLIREELAALDKIDNPTSADHMRRVQLEDSLARGHDMAAYMREKGYSSISNRTETAIKPDSEFVPSEVLSTYKRLVEPPKTGPMLRAYDKATTGVKHGLLALSPSWNVSNIGGNAMMAMVRGGMTPGDLVKYVKRAREILRKEQETGSQISPARIHGTGGTAEMLREMAGGKEPRTPLGKTINASYSFNEGVDNVGKVAMFEFLKDKGLPEEAAIKQTLRAMGDFSNLSPAEQSIKRVLPFYAWQRHATKMGYDMVTKHPWRTAAILDVAQQGRGDPSDPENQVDPSDPRSSAVNVGGDWFLPIGGIDPFRSSVNSPIFSTADVAKSLNPLIKGAAFMGLDLNLSRGRMNTRPKGTGPMDSSGNRKLGAPSAGESAYYLSQLFPLTRMGYAGVNAANGTGALARYDQGSPILSRKKVIKSDGGNYQAITRPLSLPILPIKIDQAKVEKNKKAQRDKKKKAQKN